MIAVMNDVAQKRRLGIEIVQDYIDMAIMEKIAEGRAVCSSSSDSCAHRSLFLV